MILFSTVSVKHIQYQIANGASCTIGPPPVPLYISVIHDWLTALEDGNEVCVVFFNVQKAFDSVPHSHLI